ncbi:hypothetical protein [Algisphaera agarilytica]|uniref:Uncharacterized protein n=1 Tax=Algisphaera agarilytica TaxID=1385975 RepID=A0A7X0LK42_9BACT|nr:hypothetical protein [Algisphaera agarilytica]MBB6429434.1 hypothetical protein [Algisphaera agarilytica]
MPDSNIPEQPEAFVELSPEDAAALDAVMGARAMGSEAGPMPAGSKERVEKVRGVLALLDQVAAADAPQAHAGESVIQSTLARVAAQREAEKPIEVTPLCEDDGRALDAVVANAGQPGPVPAGLGDRTQRVAGVLSLLDQMPREDAAGGDEDLIQRTLAAAADARQRERFAQQIEMFAEPRRTFGVSLRQVFTAAAVLLLGISLLMPALDHQRQAQQIAACSYNLGVAGQQIGQYSMDHAGMLPRGPVGDSWIKTGQPDAIDDAGRYQSNSAHLYILIRDAYVAPSRLACASNDRATVSMPGSGQLDWASHQAISYSYQNQHGVAPIRVDRSSPRLAVLADKNPLFIVKDGKVVYDREAKRDAASLLHGGKGQNILMLDGRVSWSTTPHIGGDNVWQISGHDGGYTGTEAPQDAHRDSFLVP